MTISHRIGHLGAAAVVVLLLTVSASAKDINSDAGTTGFSFLKINVGSRAVGMGGAFTGLADDEASLYYNPAGIAMVEDKMAVLEYHNYFTDIQSGFGGFVKPLGRDKVLGLHVTYMNYGEFIQTDRLGNIEGTFGGSDMVFAGTLAMKRSHQLSFGVTAKFVYESIQDYSATALALDFGVRYNSDRERYSAGLAVQNLGVQLASLGEGEKDGLPTMFRLGGAAKPPGLNSTLVADIILPLDNDILFALGAEYHNFRPLLLRIGWNSFGSNYRTDYSDNGLAGLAFGVGMELTRLEFSYAYLPAADLGDSHRVTVSRGI